MLTSPPRLQPTSLQASDGTLLIDGEGRMKALVSLELGLHNKVFFEIFKKEYIKLSIKLYSSSVHRIRCQYAHPWMTDPPD